MLPPGDVVKKCLAAVGNGVTPVLVAKNDVVLTVVTLNVV